MVVRETEGHGHTAAVARGVALCREWGATVLLTVPGDLPCLTADEVRRILEACGPAPAAVFVPSRSGLGTNAACLTPPDAVPLRFGEPSFADHLAAARARGIEPVVLSLSGRGPRHRPPGGSRARSVRRDRGRARPWSSERRPPRPRRAPRSSRSSGSAGSRSSDPGTISPRLALGGGRGPGHAVRARRRRRAQPEGRLQGRGPSGAARRRGRRRALAVEVGHAHKKDPRLIEIIFRESRRIVRMDRGRPHHGDAPRSDLRQRGRGPVQRGPRLGEPPPRGPRRLGAGVRGPRARRAGRRGRR